MVKDNNEEDKPKPKDASRQESPEDSFDEEVVFTVQPLQLASAGMIARAESTESQPGAFAILGPDSPELRRQERLSMGTTPIPQHATQQELLVHAVMVEEDPEQPSLVFDASPLVRPGTWKWITAVSLLVLMLTFAVALVFIQASKSNDSIRNPTDSDESEDSAALNNTLSAIPSSAPVLNVVWESMVPSTSPVFLSGEPSLLPSSRSMFPSAMPSLHPSSQSIKSAEPTESPTSSNPPSTFPTPAPSSMPSVYVPPLTQVGQRIVGENGGNSLGQSVALSQSGEHLAVGSHLYDFANELDTGRVRVFFLESNGKWQQIGQDIVGSEAGDQAGWAIDISADGTVVAVGSWTGGQHLEGVVRVYEYDRNDNAWNQLGQGLFGEADAAFFGGSLSLSDDGMTIVIGADKDDGSATDAGKVQSFYFNRLVGFWFSLGQTFYGLEEGDQAGSEVCISGDGKVVAMGTRNTDSENESNVGLVRVYKLHLTGLAWTSLGSPLIGTENEQGFGFSVDLSTDGMTLAASSRTGVHIFKFDPTTNDWNETETSIPFETDNIFYASNEIYIDLSPDGRTIAVSRTNDSSPGHIQVYEVNDETGLWVPAGSHVRVDEIDGAFASSISLNDNGQLAVGFPEYATNDGLNVGSVVVYELPET